MSKLSHKVDRHIDQLKHLQHQLRQDIKEMNDAQAKALFETTAEALGGLVNAFEDFKTGEEEAWKKDS